MKYNKKITKLKKSWAHRRRTRTHAARSTLFARPHARDKSNPVGVASWGARQHALACVSVCLCACFNASHRLTMPERIEVDPRPGPYHSQEAWQCSCAAFFCVTKPNHRKHFSADYSPAKNFFEFVIFPPGIPLKGVWEFFDSHQSLENTCFLQFDTQKRPVLIYPRRQGSSPVRHGAAGFTPRCKAVSKRIKPKGG